MPLQPNFQNTTIQKELPKVYEITQNTHSNTMYGTLPYSFLPQKSLDPLELLIKKTDMQAEDRLSIDDLDSPTTLVSKNKTIEIRHKKTENSFQKKLKNRTDAQLVHILRRIYNKNSSKSDWKFAIKVYRELSLRRYAIEHPSQMQKIQRVVGRHTNRLLLDPRYTMEEIGVRNKNHKESVTHAYPRSNPIKSIVNRWKKSKTSKHLDTYINAKISSSGRSRMEQKKITYLSQKEHKYYEVTFKDKKIYVGGSPVFNTNFIFALDQTGKILLAAKKEKGCFQHSSFFCGAPVQCAGLLKIHNEKLKSVLLKSGHYRPTTASGECLRKFLSDKKYLGKKAAKKLSIKKYLSKFGYS